MFANLVTLRNIYLENQTKQTVQTKVFPSGRA